MFILYSAILILTAPLISVNSVSVTKSNETLIAEALLDSLGPPTNRPVLDPTTVINVNLTFVLTQIIELNDIRQELKVAGWFEMQWHDEFIRWNASEYGVNCVRIPKDSIWKPDLTLDNNIDEDYNQFLPNAPVRVCSDGSVYYTTYCIFRSSCYINIKQFPYDNQTCTLRFSSWVHDAFELDVHPELRSLDQEEQFDDNGVWELIAVDARREVDEYKSINRAINPYVYAVFSIHLMRHHEFHLLFILIPYFFCSLLICLMFFIPIESGEKLSYGITAVLGMIVFQEIIAFSLPPAGNESTLVGKYFTSVICIGIISVFVEIMVNNIHMQGNVYKACAYVLNWYQTKTGITSKGPHSNHQTEQTVELQTEQDCTTTAPAAAEHTKKVQYYCAIFDFYFGILCLCLLFIFMFWFIIVI